ncbi:PREDICTED: uncharacterized protein At4g26450-like isoform X2 [Tarenaya hassleriana]|uniref:uncharacterized protein At4g26450-like isoform X2 n=1 Tax=Tarenaya hassleriana TaxID=28532 RepID=UPI00053C4B48|nr:PREDICTED: uncharacterized protein At4g26450-like isoform X2 [Tarenaya hassleriana]
MTNLRVLGRRSVKCIRKTIETGETCFHLATILLHIFCDSLNWSHRFVYIRGTKMHARHRNIGNGYRSGSVGMGLPSSRIPPDGSMRGHGFHGSARHGSNRGYGRGRVHPKSYQNQPLPPTPPLQRKGGGDIFMEAGRLAAEYLVSRGVLPPTVLSGEWQNVNLRKQAGELQGFRSQETRTGVSAPDADKGRFVDDYSSTGYRSYVKGRRSNRYGSAFGRNGSWSDRRHKATDVEADTDSVSGQTLPEDITSSVQRSNSGYSARKREGAGDSESELDKYNLQDEAQSKTGSSSVGKDTANDVAISKVSEGSSSLSAGSGVLKGGNSNGGGNENQACVEGSSMKNGVDLLTICKFAKVPTRTRSSLTAKVPKLDSSENIVGSSHTPGIADKTQIPGPVHSSGKADNPECTGNEHIDPSNPIGDLGHALMVEKSKCHRSNSFPGSILMDNVAKNPGLELADLHRSQSMGKGRGEKRAAEDGDLDGAKRQREWLPSLASEIDNIADEEKTLIFEEKVVESMMKGIVHDGLVDNSTHDLVQVQDGKSCGGYAEERELFPGSFKICDLNLEGASDANENNIDDPMIIFPAVSGPKGELDRVDFDLAISSSSKPLEHNTRISNDKEIEVIDLENDSPEVEYACSNSDRKQEAPFMGFSHQSESVNEIHDVRDYNEGLMMVEFIDSFGNIPPMNLGINSVPEGINHMPQDEIGLQNPEGATTLGSDQIPHADDESIFMSLGEIPLTFLQAWDQPPARGYHKPF